jgi:hypothetical protein
MSEPGVLTFFITLFLTLPGYNESNRDLAPIHLANAARSRLVRKLFRADECEARTPCISAECEALAAIKRRCRDVLQRSA